MNIVFQPWQLLLIILAGWLNRQQAAVIEYLRTDGNRREKGTHIGAEYEPTWVTS